MDTIYADFYVFKVDLESQHRPSLSSYTSMGTGTCYLILDNDSHDNN